METKKVYEGVIKRSHNGLVYCSVDEERDLSDIAGDGFEKGDRVRITIQRIEPDGAIIGFDGVKFPLRHTGADIYSADGQSVVSSGRHQSYPSYNMYLESICAILNAAYDKAVAELER